MKIRWAIVAGLVLATAGFAATPQYINHNGMPTPLRWSTSQFPLKWNLNPARNANVTGNRPVGDAIFASFNTWVVAPNTALSVMRAQDVNVTNMGFDAYNLVCFVCQADFSSEAETLAVTITTYAVGTGASDGRGGTIQFVGQILDADIAFNPNRNFSTDSFSVPEDLQTVATHEAGHFFGLDHSGVVKAVMFPYSPEVQLRLGYDDVAGISSIYPGGSQVAMGSISGTVILNGNGVFGAQVVAVSTTDAQPMSAFGIRKTPIATLTGTGGSYTLSRIPGDNYQVYAEPLDKPATNDDVDGYARAFGRSAIETAFTTRWY